MARIYASGALLDPSIINMATNAMNERIRRDRETRRPVVEAIQNAVTTAGSKFDDWRKRQYEEDLGRQRYAYLKRVTPEEYMSDPVWKAAMHEFARTGSSTPITSYMLGKQAKEEAARLKAENEAEKKRTDWRDFALGMDAAQETYAKRQQEMLKALDEGKNQEAEIARKALEALEKKYTRGEGVSPYGDLDTREVGVSPFGETAEAISAARLADREEKARKEEEEKERLLKVAEFEVSLPSTYKNDDEKKAVVDKIVNNPDLTKDEKRRMLNKIVEIDSLTDSQKKAVNASIAGHAGKKTTENLEEKDKTVELAKKAKEKKAKGYMLTKTEQDAMDKADKNNWEY
jgi:hypothetical protein